MLTAATANTHHGATFRNPNGFRPFAEREVDILLLQEVLGVREDIIRDATARFGYDVTHYVPATGLAIALKRKAEVVQSAGSVYQGAISNPRESYALRRIPAIRDSQRPRGLIGQKFFIHDGSTVTAATTHPIVFARPLVRKRQIHDAQRLLSKPFFAGRLIVGADMNHYPGPQSSDNTLAEQLGMERVDAGKTWLISGTKHQWLGDIGANLTGRQLSEFDGELDTVLYRGLELAHHETFSFTSDHRAVAATFIVPGVDNTATSN